MISSLIFEPTIFALGGTITLVIAWFFYIFGKLKLMGNLQKLVHQNHFQTIVYGHSQKKQNWKAIFFSLGIIFFSLALFRPKWGKLPQTVVQEGRNIMIALDMSRSMLAKDFMPNRLEFMKLKIRNLLEQLGPERVGLILFSDKAFVHCPFTDDFNAFFSFLDQASNQVISSGGTSIAKALKCAVSAFKSIDSNPASRVLFLVTDGEDFSPDIDLAIKTAKQEQLIVFTIGAATEEGAPVPILNRHGQEVGFEKDSRGKNILTKLNEPFLKSLSEELGGEFVQTSGSNADLDFIAKKIESFEKEKMNSRKANLYQERHNVFCAVAMLMFLFEWFL